MITLRKANTRGTTRIGWLDSKHSFSFGRYYDPDFSGFSNLLVINDDTVAPAMGFHTHGHDNMEILSYVISGELAHKDSAGHQRTITRGMAQHMSAGSGVQHSEFNASRTDPVHFYQIWILPSKRDITPAYNELPFDANKRIGKLQLIASPTGADASGEKAIAWNADASLFASILPKGASVNAVIHETRPAWVQVLRGSVSVNAQPASTGDGLAIVGEPELTITQTGDDEAEVLVFELAKNMGNAR